MPIFSVVRCRLASRCWTARCNGENSSSDTIIGRSDLMPLSGSFLSLHIDNHYSKIKTCVETLSTCSSRFRGMNDRLNNNDVAYINKLMKMLILF